MFYDVQTEGKGEINTIKHYYSNNGREWYFDTISVKELKSKVLLLILWKCFTKKECKVAFSNNIGYNLSV